MSDKTFALGVGWFLGMLTAAALCYLPGGFAEGKKAKELCEQSLPRDQECRVTAIPEPPK